MKLTYSRDAVADLTRLREFIAKENPKVARPVSAVLVQGIKKLRRFPLLGKEVPEASNPNCSRSNPGQVYSALFGFRRVNQYLESLASSRRQTEIECLNPCDGARAGGGKKEHWMMLD